MTVPSSQSLRAAVQVVGGGVGVNVGSLHLRQWCVLLRGLLAGLGTVKGCGLHLVAFQT